MKLLLISLTSYNTLSIGIHHQIISKLKTKYKKITILCYGKPLKISKGKIRVVQGHLPTWLSFLRFKDFDKVFITDNFVGGLFGIIISRINNKPVVARIGGLWKYVIDSPDKLVKSALLNLTKPYVLKNCKKVIYNSKSIVQRQYKHKWCVVYNGVDTKLFKPIKIKKTCNKLKILYIGRICKEKGLDYLFPAIDKDKVHLGIAGKGPRLKYYKNKYAFAKFYGRIKHNQLPKLINQYDIVVLPSLHNSSESFPNALLEAMACGKAVIGTKVYGITEMVKHGFNGLLIPEKDSNAIRNAIIYFIKNPKAIKTIGINGRKLAREKFEKTKQSSKFLAEFNYIT